MAGVEIDQIVPGANFFRRSEASARLGSVVARLENEIGFCVGSANGTFIDRAERAAVGDELPLYSPKSRSVKAWVLPSSGNSSRPRKPWKLERCQGRRSHPSIRTHWCSLVVSTNRLAG